MLPKAAVFFNEEHSGKKVRTGKDDSCITVYFEMKDDPGRHGFRKIRQKRARKTRKREGLAGRLLFKQIRLDTSMLANSSKTLKVDQ